MYVFVVVILKRGVVDHVKAFMDEVAAVKFHDEVKGTLMLDSCYGITFHKVWVC